MKIDSSVKISLGILIGVILAMYIQPINTALIIAGSLLVATIVFSLIRIMATRNSGNRAQKRKSTTARQTQGRVKWFNNKKGFGFIEHENGEDVFVHHRSILGSGRRKYLREGQKVSMDIVQSGYMERVVQKAIDLGFEPVEAIKMATSNVADYFHHLSRYRRPAGPTAAGNPWFRHSLWHRHIRHLVAAHLDHRYFGQDYRI